METCSTCKYSQETTCFRYPTSIRVIPTHWCGEWKKKLPETGCDCQDCRDKGYEDDVPVDDDGA